jgi:hypothetical protein
MNSYTSPFNLAYPGVRDGRPAPITCARCGCRLTPEADAPGRWLHFQGIGSRDARGCTVECIGREHDRHGLVITVS